jgi:serine/arginine repetitive matrix protein 1
LSRDTDKGTNGVPSTKDRDMLKRNQERGSYVDNMNDRKMSGHHSPDPEQRRFTKSLRSTTSNAERVSTRDSPLKNTRKHLPSQDSTDTSGDEEKGSRARENARKVNSSPGKLRISQLICNQSSRVMTQAQERNLQLDHNRVARTSTRNMSINFQNCQKMSLIVE